MDKFSALIAMTRLDHPLSLRAIQVKRLHWKGLPSRPVGLSFHGLDAISLSSRLDLNSVSLCKVGIFRVKKYDELLNLG